jgi:hypothetical protein
MNMSPRPCECARYALVAVIVMLINVANLELSVRRNVPFTILAVLCVGSLSAVALSAGSSSGRLDLVALKTHALGAQRTATRASSFSRANLPASRWAMSECGVGDLDHFNMSMRTQELRPKSEDGSIGIVELQLHNSDGARLVNVLAASTLACTHLMTRVNAQKCLIKSLRVV